MTAWLYLEPLSSSHHCSLAQSSPSSSFYWWSVSPVNHDLKHQCLLPVWVCEGGAASDPTCILLWLGRHLVSWKLYIWEALPKNICNPPLIPHLRSVGKFYLNVQNMVLWDFCDKILLLVQMIIMLVLRQSNALSRLKKILKWTAEAIFSSKKQCPRQKGKP